MISLVTKVGLVFVPHAHGQGPFSVECLWLEALANPLAHPSLGYPCPFGSSYIPRCSASWTGLFPEAAKLVGMEPLPVCLAHQPQPFPDSGWVDCDWASDRMGVGQGE